jgi:predicted DNA-binding ribbon-helix-helix protein
VHYLRQTNVLHLTETKPVFEAVLRMEQEGRPFSMDGLLEHLESRLQQLVGQLSFAEFGVREEDAPQQTLRCLAELEKMSSRREIAELRRKVREQEQAGNFEEAMRLTVELNRASSAGVVP